MGGGCKVIHIYIYFHLIRFVVSAIFPNLKLITIKSKQWPILGNRLASLCRAVTEKPPQGNKRDNDYNHPKLTETLEFNTKDIICI